MANSPSLNQLHNPSIVLPRMNLRSMLGGYFCRGRRFRDQTRLIDIPAERFLGVDVLAQPQSRQGGKSMRVFRRTHHDGINVI